MCNDFFCKFYIDLNKEITFDFYNIYKYINEKNSIVLEKLIINTNCICS